MVKSFQGVRKVAEKELQLLTVEDYMTRSLTTFHPEQTIEEVVKILISKNLSGGPVLNDNGDLVGIISEGDCLKEIVKGKYTNSPTDCGKVQDHMVHNVITITPDVNIIDAARMFLDMRVRRFPVIKDGKVVGQISQRDVMRAVQCLNSETW